MQASASNWLHVVMVLLPGSILCELSMQLWYATSLPCFAVVLHHHHHLGNAPAETVPDECQEDVYQYLITRGKNINANIPLGTEGALLLQQWHVASSWTIGMSCSTCLSCVGGCSNGTVFVQARETGGCSNWTVFVQAREKRLRLFWSVRVVLATWCACCCACSTCMQGRCREAVRQQLDHWGYCRGSGDQMPEVRLHTHWSTAL